MARVNGNALTQGLSGKISNLVFRQLGKDTVVSAVRKNRARELDSPEKEAHHTKFEQAIAYARKQMSQPGAKALYATGIGGTRTNAYQVAVADFMHAPRITHVDLRAYTGQPGQLIRIWVTDDFAVEAVAVRIEAADGALIEAGPAQALPGGHEWVFRTQSACRALAGLTVAVRASDRPGNQTEEVYAL
ncbi:hypothetical protein [Hymenobacter sp. B81]|uniref:hypothetical protein n=1 Tax=Hymenobacter sp. B81 TaxID=3344878 RepID=UPI0037DDB072